MRKYRRLLAGMVAAGLAVSTLIGPTVAFAEGEPVTDPVATAAPLAGEPVESTAPVETPAASPDEGPIQEPAETPVATPEEMPASAEPTEPATPAGPAARAAVAPAAITPFADCTIPTSKIGVTYQTASGGNTVEAWEEFTFSVNLTNLDGLAEGCEATVGIPPSRFAGLQNTTLYLNADGSSSPTQQSNSVARMVVDAGSSTMTFTLTDYASTHTGVNANGWVKAQIRSNFDRGETVPVEITVNGDTKKIGEVTGEECPDVCAAVPTNAGKWGYDAGDGAGEVTIQTPVFDDATEIHIKDVLISSNQRITGVSWASAYNCVSTWGDPGVLEGGNCNTGTYMPADVQGSDGEYVLSSSVRGVFFRLALSMEFTGSGPWKDEATVWSGKEGGSYDTDYTVQKFEAGGGASGKDKGTFSITKAIDWSDAESFPVDPFRGTWTATLPDNSTDEGTWEVAHGQTWTSDSLPTGSTVVLTETTDSGLWTPGWSSSNLTIEGGGDVSATVTNTLKVGTFEITKVVDWSGVTPTDVEFSGTWAATLGSTSVGSGDWTVNAGNDWTFTGPTLPAGATVALTENTASGWTAAWSPSDSLTIVDGQKAAITVTNTLAAGSFEVRKAIDFSDAEEFETGPFSGTWEATLPDASTQSGTWSVSEADGWAWSGPTLPAGTKVTLAEDPAAGWTPSWSATELEVSSGEPATATVTNKLKVGDFSLKKIIDWGDASQYQVGPFTGTWEATLNGEVVDSGTWELADGATWTSPKLPEGAEVTVTEDEFGSVTAVAWSKTWQAEGRTGSEDSIEDVTIADGETAGVDLTNEARLLTGTFQAYKVIKGSGASLVPATATFELHYTYPAGDGYQAGEGVLELPADGTVVTSDPLPLGAVLTLDELAPVKVSGGTWKTPELSARTVTISDDEEPVQVSVTNVITKNPSTELPHTGAGSAALWLGVAALTLVAGGLVLRRRVS